VNRSTDSVASMSRIAGVLLALYKLVLSPALHLVAGTPGACRFQPTCSEYAAIALAEHGPFRGSLMAVGRLLRCHPLYKGGFDPVPPKKNASSSRAPQVPRTLITQIRD
jgi:putative membrane protein insertion efficiency factor